MKYILMCGGDYSDRFKKPKQLTKVEGEVLVERTIRLLKENGVDDISISTNNKAFEYLKLPILKSKRIYHHDDEERHHNSEKSWLNAYYDIGEPCCYIHADVYFSENAIKTIVETKGTKFFCTRDIYDGRPVGINCKGREPLAYKVEDYERFRKAINDLKDEIDKGMFTKDPISWNVYRKLNNLMIDYDGFGSDIFDRDGDYVVIDDYTTDVDSESDVQKIHNLLHIDELPKIKVEVIEEFTLGRFNEIRNLERVGMDEIGRLFTGDRFECTEDLARYLLGDNSQGKTVVRLLEID